MDEIKSNKKAFGIYLGEPSTEKLNQFFYLHEKDLELMETIRGICKNNRRNGTLFGISVSTEIKILMGIPA